MTSTRGELRIIGGQWRSRRIRFPAAPGLRPTPDRLRETLFNWLGPWLEGRRVLDLYAGSGALGIEALSRGAREAVFVERSRRLAAALRENLARLGAARAEVRCRDALVYLRGPAAAFDLVFVDPPWSSGRAWPTLARLAAGDCLAPDHRVYLESPGGDAREFPDGWALRSEARVGGACGRLLIRVPASHPKEN